MREPIEFLSTRYIPANVERFLPACFVARSEPHGGIGDGEGGSNGGLLPQVKASGCGRKRRNPWQLLIGLPVH